MPEEQPRITVMPSRPDEVFIHFPEFTYCDTQAWSAELGIPTSALPALRDAITAHLGATTPAPSAGRDTMREAIARALAQTDDICGMDHGFTDPCIDITPDAIIDAVLAVRDGEMDRLRDQLARAHADLDNWAAAESADAAAGSYAGRAEEAEAKVAAASTAARRVRAYLAGFADVLDLTDRGPWANTVGAALNDLDTALTAPTAATEEA